jgi:hypothetical protein
MGLLTSVRHAAGIWGSGIREPGRRQYGPKVRRWHGTVVLAWRVGVGAPDRRREIGAGPRCLWRLAFARSLLIAAFDNAAAAAASTMKAIAITITPVTGE